MTTLLVATIRQGLEAQFGTGAYAPVLERLDFLVERLKARAIRCHVVILDETVRTALAGATDPPAASIVGTVGDVRAHAKRFRCDSVLLAGGHHVVPTVAVPNPVRNRVLDPDDVVLTDLPYGATGDSHRDYVGASRVVSRVPSPASGRLQDFLELIDSVGRPAPKKRGCTAIVSDEWACAGARVAAKMPGATILRLAPHYRLDKERAADLAGRWIYVNLHGYPDHEEWRAFDTNRSRYSCVMEPKSFDSPTLSGSSLFCEKLLRP